MAEARYPCPKCGATLKLANEVPAGKKIRCPKCQSAFAPVAEAKAQPAPEKAKEDDGAGTYGFISEPPPAQPKKGADAELETRSAHEERPENKQARSKRGPAQALVTKSANELLATSSLTCASCIVSVIVALWPMFFSKASSDIDSIFVEPDQVLRIKAESPDSPLKPFPDLTVTSDGKLDLGSPYGVVDVYRKKIGEVKGTIKQVVDKHVKFVGAIDVQLVATKNTVFGWLWIAAAVAAFAYNGLIVYGAVAMQNVESYNWAMAGSFLMLAPSNWALCVPAFGWFLKFVQSLAGDELLYGAILAISIWCLYVGIINVLTLRNPEVEAGFREIKSED